jgi:hypothetical protein
MFEPVDHIGAELERLTTDAQKTGSPDLAREVAKFVVAVANECDLAFADVHATLRSIAYLPPSEITPDRIKHLQDELAATYAKDKFKRALGICDRLDVLAHNYKDRIEPQLPAANASQLFWMLQKQEGSFIYIIKTAVDEIDSILDAYTAGTDIDAARARARAALRELEQGMENVTRAKNRVLGELPGGTSMLLDAGGVADEVLRRSPWFSGSFYLGAALILLTALTIVAGNVSATMFPIVVAGAFAGLTIIGAFQLRNDGRLSEEAFFKLIDLSMRRVLLPFSKAKT